MGKLTRTQIISQGINLAGKATATSAFASLVVTSWNAWLRSTYKGWLWPFLNKQATGISLAAAATSKTIGGGQGGITDDIDDIFDPIYIYDSAYQYLDKARVRQIRGGPAHMEPAAINPSTNAGIPREFKAREGSGSTEGQWVLTPYPFPDRAYLLAIDYKWLPPDTSADGDVVNYRNDRTLIYAAKVCTLEHMKAEDYLSELEVLASLVAQDFAKDAAKTGMNDNLGMDPNVFK